MLTEKQTEQAEKVILGLSREDTLKFRALKRHKNAIEMWQEYTIPYKVASDYLKQDLSSVVRINPCYPMPGYPKSEITPIKVSVPRDTIPNELIPNEEKQAEIAEYEKTLSRYRTPYESETDSIGTWYLETWCYKYGHLLTGYDILTFTAFDFHGGSDKTWCEGDLGLMQNMFKNIQEMYEKEPTKYISCEPEYKPEYDRLYTTSLYEFVYEDKAEKERNELLKRIGVKGADEHGEI